MRGWNDVRQSTSSRPAPILWQVRLRSDVSARLTSLKAVACLAPIGTLLLGPTSIHIVHQVYS